MLPPFQSPLVGTRWAEHSWWSNYFITGITWPRSPTTIVDTVYLLVNLRMTRPTKEFPISVPLIFMVRETNLNIFITSALWAHLGFLKIAPYPTM